MHTLSTPAVRIIGDATKAVPADVVATFASAVATVTGSSGTVAIVLGAVIVVLLCRNKQNQAVTENMFVPTHHMHHMQTCLSDRHVCTGVCVYLWHVHVCDWLPCVCGSVTG